MNNNNTPFLEKKSSILPLNMLAVSVLMLTIVALCALTAIGWGGIPSISISGAVFAFLLISKRNIIPWLTLPIAFGAAYLISRDLLTGASVLLFVPVGALLAYFTVKKKNLSVTVVALTIVTILSAGLYLTLSVTQLYGSDVRESFIAFGKDIEEAAKELLSAFRYEDSKESGEQFGLPEEGIAELVRVFFMLVPSVIAIICQLTSYGAAKLCRLGCHLFGYDSIYNGAVTKITVSAPAGAIFVVSYFISFIAGGESVVAYSALNLTYMLMPMLAIGGFHTLFGAGGVFRRKAGGPVFLAAIICCALCAVLSPFSFVPLLAMFGAMGAVGRAVGEFIKERNKGQNDR